MMEDWRFQESPYVESGGLRAYAGAPLRLQNEFGDCVGIGSLCVASSTSQEPLTKPQQDTLACLADWVVSDIVQCARARRQRERHRMSELISKAQGETDDVVPEEPVLRILRTTYPDAVISLPSSKDVHIEIEGRDPILSSDLESGLWEDIDYIDDFIASLNHQDLSSTRVVRVIAAPCENMSRPSLLVVASKDLRLVFDDVDSWFVQTCASMISQTWHKRLLTEVMRVKEKFLRGFSHHLRTPIHGILSSTELLAEELKSRNLRESTDAVSTLPVSPAADTGVPSIYLNTIKAAGRDLISIVNSMITLNRWADIAMKDRCYAIHTTYDLETELANEILKTFSGDTRYRAFIFFNHDLPPGCESLRVDLSLLRDCLLPLVINAIQSTPEGIVVVTASIRSDHRELIVDVEDTGRGIPRDYHQRIFELYEKVDMHSTGIGLGLTLASKFATLLHGSVSLMSSVVDGGSHFRATFQEVEFACSPHSSQLQFPKLKHVPSKFYYMASGSNGASLCDFFSKFLTCRGFTSSDSIEDCLTIFDFVSDFEQRRKYLSKLPLDQVAICLIPASEEESCFEQTPGNVVYFSGPFLTSTMSSALEEADRLLSEIKASRVHLFQPEEPLSTLPKIDEGSNTDESSSTDEGYGSMADLPHSKEQPDQAPAINPANPVSGATVPLTYQPDSAAPVESTIVIPIYSAFRGSPNPTALIVDDNVLNLRIMQMYCSKRGLPYCSATNGLQAIELFLKHQSLSATGEGASIQLILMDLQMPVCDGIEATRQIRWLEKQNKWRETTLFIVTGQDSPTDRTSADDAGADEYFVKPVGIKLLDRAVKRYFPAFEAS
jgi:signal transduction histidine kinase/ActR/RegA family two-component response regulator